MEIFRTQITTQHIAAYDRHNPDTYPVAAALQGKSSWVAVKRDKKHPWRQTLALPEQGGFRKIMVKRDKIVIDGQTFYANQELMEWLRVFDIWGKGDPAILVLEHLPDLGMSYANLVR